MGKGSAERPVDRKKFRKNWDAIFGEAQGVEFVDMENAAREEEARQRERQDAIRTRD